MPQEILLDRLGRNAIRFLEEAGRMTLLLGGALRWMARGRLEPRLTIRQMSQIGVDGLPLIVVTGAFAGMVVAFQSAGQLNALGVPGFVGGLVAVSLAREAAPVFTAVTAAGRTGAGIAAELGTMAVTEQLDALRVMATDPVRYLVVPRVLASLIVLPILTIFANVAGLIGGWGVAGLAGVGTTTYLTSIRRFLELHDLVGGLVKAALFGMIIAVVGSHRGLTAAGGAEGVGRAATAAVVVATLLILGGNYVLDVLLF
ncbi:MAG TPA: ABC transporter permease [Gemmatimonadales bacterium]|nr:ABC transporter permease [Gemmatimonadales bacterium]